jgi:hypothetical protein
LGYNLITGISIKELPIIGIKYLTWLFSAILLNRYFLEQWKVTQMILILKPVNLLTSKTSYPPTSLLPIVSKVFERLLPS